MEIARLADTTALLLVPGMGDDVQTFKAGVMEIADVFVINKADRPGADRVEQEVTTMLSIARREDSWRPPIVKTVATTGEGVASLREALEEFRAFGEQSALKLKRQREQCRARILELLRQTLFEKAVTERQLEAALDRHVEEVLARQRDPHSAAEALIEDFMVSRREALKSAR